MSLNMSDLEKLEALHAAATPPDWKPDGTGGLSQTNHVTRDVWTIPRTQADIDAIAALHDAFPDMAAALREAWEISKCRRNEGLDWVQAAFDFQRERDEARQERDEALALKQHWAADADAKEALLQAVARACRDTEPPTQEVLAVLGNVLRHRDEAREENKRLKALLQEMCGYITPTQDQFAPILNRANLVLRSVPTLGATYEVL